MSESLESVRWNACMHTLDLALYSHPKEFLRMDSEPTLTPRENLLHLFRRCITQNSERNIQLTELFRPPGVCKLTRITACVPFFFFFFFLLVVFFLLTD